MMRPAVTKWLFHLILPTIWKVDLFIHLSTEKTDIQKWII